MKPIGWSLVTVMLTCFTPLDTALSQSPSAQSTRTAEVALAEAAARRGDRTDAVRRASAITDAYGTDGNRWPSVDRVAAGRAYLLLSAGSATAVRQALAAFDAAAAADSANLDARLRAAELLLDKYNFPDAKRSFEDVLRRAPDNPRALLGLARVAANAGDPQAMPLLRRSLAADPSLVDAQLMLARVHLEAEAYDSAAAAARRALATDSASGPAWALLGAAAWLSGDSARYELARAAAHRLNPRPSDFYAELAEAAARQRRYADGVRLARQALALDSSSTRALGLVGTNELRAGNMEEGRARLERAFAIDPFNLWHKNTLDLLDRLRTFRTIERGRFRIVAPPEEAELLTTYLMPLLEDAYDSLAARYHYRPPAPIRLELYRRHADFSVRTVGLAGLGALGVSFGPVLAMDAPSARGRGDFNWGSTAWHELAHTFTLGLSDNRAPRWLSEGLSVLEERRARAGWGADVSVDFLAAYAGGRLRKPSQLNDGFVQPRFPSETILSYYAASLVCEMIEAQFGLDALVRMLTAYRDGLSTPAVFARVLGVTPDSLDARFDAWLRAKFAVPLRSVAASGNGEPGGAFISTTRTGAALLGRSQPDSARVVLEQAQALFPEYAGSGAPAELLARLARDRGDLRAALDQITRITTRNESAWDANLFEAELREKLGDSLGAMVPLERLIWISPYDVPLHVRLAEHATRAGDHALAIRERRAVLTLDPPDPLEARYQLARALAAGGDTAAARRELLTVLETAPSFEKGQALLLELRATGTPGAKP
jgi:tetratricopeptide (TPR) repeat protein